jgi:hypothetical protein
VRFVVEFGGIECMFEAVSEVDLIDVMGEASRDESTAIAHRLAAVGELYARTLRERLPALAKVFATGVIDFRMVLTIIAATSSRT